METEDLIEVGEYMRRLEEDGSVRIVFESFKTIYGLTYKGANGNYLMVINKDISYKSQIETLWHEAKHIYSHIDAEGDLRLFEKEADKFAERCIRNSDYLIDQIRTAW